MKGTRRLMVILMAILVLAFGCSRENIPEEAEEEVRVMRLRPEYQKDKTLVIALDTEFGSSFNPFLTSTHGEDMVLSVIFSSPLSYNSKGELIPWFGNIFTGRNADGSVSYLVSLEKDLCFTDGEPITIDDYIYPLYVMADPSYTGPNPLIDEDIRGIESYYYNDPDWEENLSRIDSYLDEHYSMDTITQDDFTYYLVSSRLEGHYDDLTKDEWMKKLGETSWKTEVDSVKTDEELLELVALSEYADNACSYDPLGWYSEKMRSEYLQNNLNGDKHVETIEGIQKVDQYTARITVDAVNTETFEHLNVFLVPYHYYGEYKKGDISPVLEKDIPLGSGPYSFYAEYDEKVKLKANDVYREGIPNIGSVEFVSMSEDEIVKELRSGTIDIGLLSGDEEHLEILSHKSIGLDLVPEGSYPSIFINAETRTEEDRQTLYSIFLKAARELPISQIEKKVEHPISPLIAEYPDELQKKSITDDELILDGKEPVVLLIDETLPRANLDRLVRNLNSSMRMNGSALDARFMSEDEIRKEMKEGKADAAILESTGTLQEKAEMYHSNGRDNIQNIDDAMLDEIMENVLVEPFLDERRKLTGMLSKRIEDEGLEVPLYQRRAIIAYNMSSLDMESVPDVSTSSWNFLSSLWSIRKK